MLGNFIVKLYLKYLEYKGFHHGKNFNLEKGANIDACFCKLISCGNNVTIARNSYILGHDASMKKFLGKTKCGKTTIGNDVFIGSNCVVHPGVTIGNNVIVATNSSVVCDIPSGEVWGGVPAKFIMTTECFLEKHSKQILLSNSHNKFFYID